MDLFLMMEQRGIMIPRQYDDREGRVGYNFLKENPEKIAQIPELRGFPEAEELIRAVNGEESGLRTVGPLRAVCDGGDQQSKRCVFYVGLTFEDAKLKGDKTAYYSLFDRLTQYANSLETERDTVIEAFLTPTLYDEIVQYGWSMGLYVYGYADAEEGARAMWATAVQVLKDFLAQEASRTDAEEVE
jgi:hypothetical protein